MATLILRPISDVNIKHSLSSGSSAYSLINESSQDGDSTYVYQYVQSTSSQTVTSTLNVGGFNSTKINITKCMLYLTAKSTSDSNSKINVIINANGTTMSTGASTLSSSYTTKSMNCTTILDAMNAQLSNGEMPSISLQVQTSGAKSSSKDDNFQIRVTQIYLEITYDVIEDSGEDNTGLYVKVDGAYVAVKAVWKKINGKYVKQTDILSLLNTNMRYIRLN